MHDKQLAVVSIQSMQLDEHSKNKKFIKKKKIKIKKLLKD
jgi:hypothetical protein